MYNTTYVYFKKYILYVAWAQALIATLVSLYFSEIVHLPPCVLCWYQRVLMYPLVVITAVGILKKDKGLHVYVLPLSIVGMVIAAYHYLLQRGIIPDRFAPCSLGISCTTKYVEWFGMITIPFLSLVAFAIVTTCMIIFWRSQKT